MIFGLAPAIQPDKYAPNECGELAVCSYQSRRAEGIAMVRFWIPEWGPWVIHPSPYHDERGRFMRAWCVRELEGQGIHFLPVQANMQLNQRKGTIRRLQLQMAPALERRTVAIANRTPDKATPL